MPPQMLARQHSSCGSAWRQLEAPMQFRSAAVMADLRDLLRATRSWKRAAGQGLDLRLQVSIFEDWET